MPNSNGRVLQGVDNDHITGTIIAAGLPNITGQMKVFAAAYDMPYANGVFSSSLIDGTAKTGTQNGSGDLTIDFNASASNPVYGNSSTVQPPALAINFCIKY